ncbi:Gfo/Idh/MocA family oxidoreductase [Paenibacillus sp. HB172176]|uniref:Gfo/Idh/MocA family protein n=1 Tax=Paenibacillus sp. HB172176 TaxID=2493690 RepID=UPI001439F3C6|nr:Gfo/Idh/MocA family oxidoreductase [Paenibacillus sp. HB172176]
MERMKHRILLVGHGNISSKYVGAVRDLEQATIVGVVGRNEERVSAFAKANAIPVWSTDMADAAKRSGATAAMICTPNGSHYEAVMAASKLGLHCLCEKPLHYSSAKQREMIESCKENGVKLAVSYMRRFTPHLREVKDMLDAGKLGEVRVVDVVLKHFREKSYYDSWHGTSDQDGGGPFIQQGSHIIDMALWLCGGYREVLAAKLFQAYHDGIETEDHGYAIVSYAGGAVGMIEASTACKGTSEERIEISGTKGSIAVNFGGILASRFDDGDEPERMAHASDSLAVEPLFAALVKDFLAAIEENRKPEVDGESASLATALVEAIYREAGEPVSLNKPD